MTSVVASTVDQLRKKYFFDPMVDAVHSAHPFKLILRFQRFSNAFRSLYLRKQMLEASGAGFVDFMQLLHELAGQQEAIEESGAIFFEICCRNTK